MSLFLIVVIATLDVALYEGKGSQPFMSPLNVCHDVTVVYSGYI